MFNLFFLSSDLIQSIILSIIFLLSAGGTAFTSMVLLNTFVVSKSAQNDLIAIFVVETIGSFGMIVCYVSALLLIIE